MENGPKSENGKKNGQKKNGPQPEMGEKMAQKWPKLGFGVIFLFRAKGHFLFFANFFPFLDFGRFPFYTRWPDSQF